MKKLTLDQINSICASFGIEKEALRTIIRVECSGDGFNEDGSLKIQFEPLWFARYLKQFGIPYQMEVISINGRDEYNISAKSIKFSNGIETQSQEYEAFNKACLIHKEAAMLSTSFGMGQIMGFNHKAAGYATAEHMVIDFKNSEMFHVIGMVRFMRANKNLWAAFKSKNWDRVAFYYNGAAYKSMKYDTKLAAEYQNLTQNLA